MRRVKLDQLEAFAKVVESGSFRRAAEHLGLTQPAISLRVRELERRFGLRLVECVVPAGLGRPRRERRCCTM